VTTRRILLSAIIATGLALAATGAATAQTYPDRPIKLIVPFPPGGPTDYVARLVAQHASVSLGQIVIDNRAGAGGTIAAKAVAGADPDGYTLLYGSSATLGIAPALYKGVDYDPIRSFAPIALVSRVPFVLGIAAALPAGTLAEFIAYAKANPGRLNFGAGIGTPPHHRQQFGEFPSLNSRGRHSPKVPYRGSLCTGTESDWTF
jgi:tripartite-type tricarboxylate transporter receptor subunit TctC